MFGQEMNKTQERTYLQDITKINWCMQEGIKVTTKSWRKINLPNEFKAAAFEQEGKLVKWVKKEAVEALTGGDEVVFAKYSRKDYIDNLRKILAMEIKSMFTKEKDTTESMAYHADQHRVAKLNDDIAQSKLDIEVNQALELEKEFGSHSKTHQK
jgi:hypothetical protein